MELKLTKVDHVELGMETVVLSSATCPMSSQECLKEKNFIVLNDKETVPTCRAEEFFLDGKQHNFCCLYFGGYVNHDKNGPRISCYHKESRK